MIVCPMCENRQEQGDTCDVCGKRLSFEPPTSAQYPPLPDLEVTSFAEANVAIAAMPELDVHRHADANVVLEKIPDLLPTEIADAKAPVAAEVVPELERTRVEGDGQRTALSDTTTCRYCGQVQKRTNRLCDKCANALPTVVRAKPKDPEAALVRCPGCGFDAPVNKACPACGFFIRAGD